MPEPTLPDPDGVFPDGMELMAPDPTTVLVMAASCSPVTLVGEDGHEQHALMLTLRGITNADGGEATATFVLPPGSGPLIAAALGDAEDKIRSWAAGGQV